MRIVNRGLLTVCATVLLATLALAGCAPTPSPTPSTSAATDAPVFASDEEALAAATSAYAAYLEVGDLSGTANSTTREAYLALTTGQAHDDDLSAEKIFDERGWRKTGTTSSDSMSLQSSALNAAGAWEIRTYLCLDVTQSNVVDAAGQSMVQPDRPLRLPLEVAFVVTSQDPHNLLVSESKVWSGSDFC